MILLVLWVWLLLAVAFWVFKDQKKKLEIKSSKDLKTTELMRKNNFIRGESKAVEHYKLTLSKDKKLLLIENTSMKEMILPQMVRLSDIYKIDLVVNDTLIKEGPVSRVVGNEASMVTTTIDKEMINKLELRFIMKDKEDPVIRVLIYGQYNQYGFLHYELFDKSEEIVDDLCQLLE